MWVEQLRMSLGGREEIYGTPLGKRKASQILSDERLSLVTLWFNINIQDNHYRQQDMSWWTDQPIQDVKMLA